MALKRLTPGACLCRQRPTRGVRAEYMQNWKRLKSKIENALKTPQTNTALERTITRVRLGKYLEAKGNDWDAALKLYEDNMKLSESFYVPLQCLEVCLRNCIHEQMSNVHGADWLQKGPLSPDSKLMVNEALAELKDKSNLSPGDLVAELKFAFWVGLLGPHYDATLWRNALYKAFLARTGQRRSIVHRRMNALRRLRNRVMHHEPIFDRSLDQMHNEIIEAIGWMCRETEAWVAHHSRYQAVATSIAPAPVIAPAV
jgi:hypothetical protein